MPGQKVMAHWARGRYAGSPMVVCDMQDLVWLMNMTRTPYGEIRKDDNGHDRHGDHGRDERATHLAKVEIHHHEKIDEHALAVGSALKKAMLDLDQANSYVASFVDTLKKPGNEPVNCRVFMNSWWQSRLWMGEAFKRFAEAHAAIERLQAHVSFAHECAEDPCTEPVEYGGGKIGRRRQTQTHAEQAK